MKWFHLIGVSGKTTANIAKVFQEMGWFVTGSDSQFIPPASDLLVENKINTVEGYNYIHLTKQFWVNKLKNKNLNDLPENPDLVLFISHLSSKNKEYLYSKKKNLDVKPYSRILGEYLIKKNSIVVIGTAGKTTTTALLTLLLQKLNLDPSYMIGAEVSDISDSLKITDSDFSVIEGDEYHNPDPEIEGKAKFMEYKPKYLVITNIGWEHQDIFKTQEDYISEFKKCVDIVPSDGVIVAHYGDENINKTLESTKAKVIRYCLRDSGKKNDYKKENVWSVSKNEHGSFYIYDPKDNIVMEFNTKLIGDYNLENILASIVLILNLPSQVLPVNLIREGTNNLKTISSNISEFIGPKKRLEKLFENDDILVIDDFGVAPSRAENSLKTIHQNYPNHKIVAVFEPNSGSRTSDNKQFKSMYKNAFKNAEVVIIPDLSAMNNELIESNAMVLELQKLGYNSVHISNNQLVNELRKRYLKKNEKTIFVFFSSYRLTEVGEAFAKSLK